MWCEVEIHEFGGFVNVTIKLVTLTALQILEFTEWGCVLYVCFARVGG